MTSSNAEIARAIMYLSLPERVAMKSGKWSDGVKESLQGKALLVPDGNGYTSLGEDVNRALNDPRWGLTTR